MLLIEPSFQLKYHESLVPGLDLLLGEVGVVDEEGKVVLRELLAAAVAHGGCGSGSGCAFSGSGSVCDSQL